MNRLPLTRAERNILSGILGCEPDQVGRRLQQGGAAGVGGVAPGGGVAEVCAQVHQVRDQGFVVHNAIMPAAGRPVREDRRG